MKTSVYRLLGDLWEMHVKSNLVNENKVSLVLCFASKTMLQQPNAYKHVREKFPVAEIALCSTSGEIYHDQVEDHSFVVAAIEFETTKVVAASVNVKDYSNSYLAAASLAKQLPQVDLAHVLLFSDGSLVNGSDLVKGLSTQINKQVLVTGGLAGDDGDFKSTLVGLNKQPTEGEIVAIGLYGKNIQIAHGSQGGWDQFGLEKRVTSASGNVLFEIEHQNALELYKRYLGEESKNLPGSALLFPLSVTMPGARNAVVRTILSVNETEKSMTFAGDVPEGSYVRFMKANFTKLTYAAAEAAELSLPDKSRYPDFSLLISCVGRKLILGNRTVEEVKSVGKTFNNQTIMAGFYSYGEISPFQEGGSCQLHNQTMTITSFYETTES